MVGLLVQAKWSHVQLRWFVEAFATGIKMEPRATAF